MQGGLEAAKAAARAAVSPHLLLLTSNPEPCVVDSQGEGPEMSDRVSAGLGERERLADQAKAVAGALLEMPPVPEHSAAAAATAAVSSAAAAAITPPGVTTASIECRPV